MPGLPSPLEVYGIGYWRWDGGKWLPVGEWLGEHGSQGAPHGLPGLASIHVSCLHHLSDLTMGHHHPVGYPIIINQYIPIIIKYYKYIYNFQYIICLSLYPNIPKNDGFASLVVFYGYFSAYPHGRWTCATNLGPVRPVQSWRRCPRGMDDPDDPFIGDTLKLPVCYWTWPFICWFSH